MSTTISPRTHLRQLDSDLLNELVAATGESPCISLYMPMHRKGADTRENHIRFKSAMKRAVDELGNDNLLGPLMSLEHDNDFWQHQLDGLAIFASSGRTYVVRLPRPVKEKVAVADSFHVKPLIRILQAAGRYHLLTITQKSVHLFEGDMEGLHEVALDEGVPKSITEALGDQVEGEINVHSYGGLAAPGMFHGHSDKKDERDAELERYFRVVDKAIYDHHMRGSDLPLYLAADVDYHDRFHKASHHPRLQDKGVRVNPDAQEVDAKRLLEEMQELTRPAYDQEIDTLIEHFGNAKAKAEGSDDLDKVAEAAVAGKIFSILLDGDRSVGGTVDPATGKVKLSKESKPDVDDVLDDIAELALRTGAKVRVIPGDKHPTDSGVAAVFRY